MLCVCVYGRRSLAHVSEHARTEMQNILKLKSSRLLNALQCMNTNIIVSVVYVIK